MHCAGSNLFQYTRHLSAEFIWRHSSQLHRKSIVNALFEDIYRLYTFNFATCTKQNYNERVFISPPLENRLKFHQPIRIGQRENELLLYMTSKWRNREDPNLQLRIYRWIHRVERICVVEIVVAEFTTPQRYIVSSIFTVNCLCRIKKKSENWSCFTLIKGNPRLKGLEATRSNA